MGTYKRLILALFLFYNSLNAQPPVHDIRFDLNNNQSHLSKEYVAREQVVFYPGYEFNGYTDGKMIARIDPSQTIPVQVIQNAANIPQVSNYTINTSLPVGALSGIPSVSPSGAAVYEVPLDIPPGTKNLQPSVSIAYNSQAGIGIAGYGWNITGISAVTRTNKNLYYDNVVEGFDFTANDALMLDGKRLIKTGNNTYVIADGSNYEQIQYYPQGNYFIVKNKEGLTYEYGKTDDSKLNIEPNKTLAWNLNRVYDLHGNYINYKYYNFNNQEQYIAEIEYTGNENKTPYNRILFYYDDRTNYDNQLYYIKGNTLKLSKILSKIKVISSGNLFKEYLFSYFYDNHAIKLSEIKIKNADGQYLNPLRFDYGINNFLFTSNSYSLDNIYHITGNLINYGDFNGDGFTDLIRFLFVKVNNFHVLSKLIIYSGKDQSTFEYAFNTPNQYNNSIGFMYVFDKYYSWLKLGDFDGDGKTDILITKERYFTDNQNHLDKYVIGFHIYGFNENNNFVKKKEITLNNGETASYSSQYINAIQNLFAKPIKEYNYYTVGDFDGDGASDILIPLKQNLLNGLCNTFLICPAKDKIYNFQPSSNSTDIFKEIFEFGDKIIPLNFRNSGGKQQLAVIYNTPKPISISNYSNNQTTTYQPCSLRVFELVPNDVQQGTMFMFASKILLNNNFFNKDHIIYDLGDFNGDGLTDIIYGIKEDINENEIKFYVNIAYSAENLFKNEAFQTFLTGKSDEHTYNINPFNILVGNFNGDNLSDILTLSFIINENPMNGVLYKTIKSKIYYSKGANQFTFNDNVFVINSTQCSSSQLFIFDSNLQFVGNLNNDNKSDILFLTNSFYENHSKVDIYTLKSIPDHQFHILAAVDGFKRYTYFNYSYTTDGVYSSSATLLADKQNYFFPFYVVSELKTSNGLGNGLNTFNYAYRAIKYNRSRKQLLGFYETEITDVAANRKTKSLMTFNNNLQMLLPYKTITYGLPSNNIIASSENQNYQFKFVPNTNNKAYFAYPENTILSDYLNYTQQKNTFAYDNDFNLTEQYTYIYPLNTSQYDNVVHNTYQYIDPINFGKPSRISQKQTTNTYKNNSPFTQTFLYSYNNKGEIISEHDVNKNITTFFEDFNNFGLPEKVRATTPSESDRTSYVKYDDFGRFIIKKTNAIGHTETLEYDNTLAALIKHTDINGNSTTYEYDKWGRIVKETYPDGLSKSYQYLWSLGNPYNNVVYTVASQITDETPVYTYYDKLNRNIATKYKNYGSDIMTYTEFDNMGRTVKELGPSFPLNLFGNITLPDNISFYQYYSQGDHRLKRKQYMFTPLIYNYNQLQTTVTDTLGRSTINYYDAVGNVLQSVFPTGSLATLQYNSLLKPINIDATGAPTTMQYNHAGYQTQLFDANAGPTNYEYNGFGELKKQTNANQYSDILDYDILGRPTTINTHEGTYTTEYVQNGNGIGKVAKQTAPNGHIIEYQYDELARPSYIKQKYEGNYYTANYTYNQHADINTYTYPDGFQIQYIYNNEHELIGIKRTDNNNIIWTCNEYNASGQPLKIYLGNSNKKIEYQYDTYKRLSSITCANDFQYTYQWDMHTGNLISRTDHYYNNTETFTYDLLDRLTGWNVNNNYQHTVQYDNKGNITYKSDAGTFLYNLPQPHAISGVQNAQNAVLFNKQQIEYTSFNQPKKIIETDLQNNVQHILELEYGFDKQRIKSLYKIKNLQTGQEIIKWTRYYFGDYEKEINEYGQTTDYCYIKGPAGNIAIIVTRNGQKSLYYTLTDHLASIVAIMDEQGNIIERTSYDPWGRIRNAGTWLYDNAQPLTITYRGFTMHEMLPEFGLINMNGRLYDPALARMLSPDNYVPAPHNPQAYNRYSYCLNNPLMYTDPSGEFIFTALLTPIGLTPVGMILDAACWGGAIDLGIQGIQIAAGTRENINWAQVGGAAVTGAVFGGMGLLSPSFTVSSTSFMKNLPTYLGKAGWAGLTGIASSGAGMLATDIFEGGGIDYSGEDYLRTMGTAGAFSFGLSFASSMYEYGTWDRLSTTDKITKIQNKFGSNVHYISSLPYDGLYTGGNNYVEIGPSALNKGKGYAFSTARHELNHLSDWNKYTAGKLTIPTRRSLLDHFEIRSYKLEMRYNRVTQGNYLDYIDFIKTNHGYKGFGTFLPNPFMYYNTIF
ncbi:MAG: hypothetical protein HPY79_11465 [Bacteroidales bacterium]|nr:hypothetical protein [Bacteroidales bacterium]